MTPRKAACLLVFMAAAACRGDGFEATVRAFSADRHKLARDLSARLGLSLPSEAHDFFGAATTGQWDLVSSRFARVEQPAGSGVGIPALRNELWTPVRETMGLWELWVGWQRSDSLLAMSGELVLDSMPQGSIYFGGTAFGRFAVTALNAQRKPEPVFCITQNALSDHSYTAHLRCIHGDSIWLPGPDDWAAAFARHADEVASGKRPQSGNIEMEGARITVLHPLGVMEINEVLCEMVFERNRGAHEFYVEGSYVMPWMYPYLEPHGLILKLNGQPLKALSAETVARDRRFWAGFESRLMSHAEFGGNVQAAKTFAKLRSAIAGVYAFRELHDEAQSAFEQALRICPDWEDARLRLAEMRAGKGRDVSREPGGLAGAGALIPDRDSGGAPLP